MSAAATVDSACTTRTGAPFISMEDKLSHSWRLFFFGCRLENVCWRVRSFGWSTWHLKNLDPALRGWSHTCLWIRCGSDKESIGWLDRMSHRKWRETKQQLIWWPEVALLGCCLVSLNFLCDILSSRPVQCCATIGSSETSIGQMCLYSLRSRPNCTCTFLPTYISDLWPTTKILLPALPPCLMSEPINFGNKFSKSQIRSSDILMHPSTPN